MKDVRFWCTTFFVWMFVVLSLGKWQGAISLPPLVDLLVAACALSIILVPRLRNTPLLWLLILATVAFVLLKVWLGHRIAGTALPLAITQWLSLGVTVALSQRVGRSIEELSASLAGILLNRARWSSIPFEIGQGEMYREIRRARIHRRPLSLLVVSSGKTQAPVSLDRFIRKIVDDMARDCSQAQVAEFLSGQLKDCDITTERDGHFVVMLPETDRETAHETVRRLQAAARQKAGLELDVGVAAFPDEEVTFVGLLERAESGVLKRVPAAPPEAASDVGTPSADAEIDFRVRPGVLEMQAMHRRTVTHGNGAAARLKPTSGDDDNAVL